MESKKWLTDLKLAIINKELESLEKLGSEIPVFSEDDNLQEALALIKQASKILQAERVSIKRSLENIKKTKEYLQV